MKVIASTAFSAIPSSERRPLPPRDEDEPLSGSRGATTRSLWNPPAFLTGRHVVTNLVATVVGLLVVALMAPTASAQQLGTWSYVGGVSTVNSTISANFPGGRSGFASFVDPVKRTFYLFGGLGVPDVDGVSRKFSRPS